jgi:hypothetical protein
VCTGRQEFRIALRVDKRDAVTVEAKGRVAAWGPVLPGLHLKTVWRFRE